jgi:hypothetical protein
MQPHQVALLAVIISWTEIGLGLHAADVMAINPNFMVEGAKRLYICVFLFDSSISYPKLAAVFFYARVFRSNNRAFTIHLWIAGALVSGWLVSTLISSIWQCQPIAKAWNPALEGTCIDNAGWYTSTAAISTATDFYILILPVPMIWGLNASLKRRIYLLAAFFLAYSVIILSIGRLVMTIKLAPTLQLDLTWNMAEYFYWVCFEGVFSIISINVPSIVALVKTLTRRWFPAPSGSGSGPTGYTGNTGASYGSKSTAYRSANRDRGFTRLGSAAQHGGGLSSDSQDALKPVDADDGALALGHIHVRTDVMVQHDGSQRP